MQRKRAFTLIELLVVIAIIAILAAILFPVFAKARERAKQSKSLNNIKQLALAIQTYSQDYQETFPGWSQATATTFAHNVWDEQINPQVKSKDVYNNGDTGIQSWSQPTGTTHDRVLTYGLNALLITPAKTAFDGNADFATVNTANPPAPLSPSAIGNPAGTILLAELSTNAAMNAPFNGKPNPLNAGANTATTGSSQWMGAWPGWIDISPRAFIEDATPVANCYNEPYATGSTDKGVARDLYGGGGSYAFCDGHVKFMKIGQSVGLGSTVSNTTISTTNCWAPANINNMWNPQ